MNIIFQIAFGVYLAAISVYSALLLRSQKKSFETGAKNGAVPNGKIALAAVLGGAAGIYVTMFLMKYKLKSLSFMISMPVLAALHVYLAILFFTGINGSAFF